MAKKTWIKQNGSWKEIKNVWTNVNGVWKQKVIPKGNILNTWKEFKTYGVGVYGLLYQKQEIGGTFIQDYDYRPSGTSTFVNNSYNVMRFNNTNRAVSSIRTSEKIDVTSFSKLHIEWEATTTYDANIRIGLSSVASKPGMVVYLQQVKSFNKMISTVDISSITGLQYVRAFIEGIAYTSNQAINLSIYNIWLE